MSRAIVFIFLLLGLLKKGVAIGGRAALWQLEMAYGIYSQHHKS